MYSSPGSFYVRCALAHTTGVLLDCDPIRVLRQGPTKAFIAALRFANANYYRSIAFSIISAFLALPISR